MTAADYYNLLIEHISLWNATFEFWISITFAFLATLYFAKNDLSNNIFRLLIALYSATSTVFIVRFLYRNAQYQTILNTMAENNIAPPPWRVVSWNPYISVWLILIMILGTVGSIYFAIRQTRTRNGT